MAIGAVLTCVAALLALAGLGVVVHNRPSASRIIYSASLALSSVILIVAVVRLLTWPSPDPEATLPVGLPWIGARFRIDALSAFFLAVINFGAAAASLYALGYGEHEEHPGGCCRSIRRSSPE